MIITKNNNMNKNKLKSDILKLRKNSFIAEVLKSFTTNPQKQYDYMKIAKSLGLTDKASVDLVKSMLEELVKVQAIVETGAGKYKLNPELLEDSESETVLEGIVDMKSTGKAYVSVEGRDEDIFIAAGNTGQALHGDTVQVRLFPLRKNKKLEGRIIKVVRRYKEHYVGIFQKSQKYGFVIPDGDNMIYDFFIPQEYFNGAKDGEKVVVKILEWREKSKNPVAKIVEVLGKPGDNDVEMKSILVNNSFPLHFPEQVQNEARKIPKEISQKEISPRRDFRNAVTFTIDPADAKDFDDALSIEFRQDGTYLVGVHIADVSHYVKPDSLIDKEAYERATSIYLVDRTIPMLPEELSNSICSLEPNKDRLCFSVVFEMDEKANVLHTWFGKTVIHSDKRYNYEEIQEIIEGKDDIFDKEIRKFNELAKILRTDRFNNGAIDFGSSEVKFKLDENGKPIEVELFVAQDSNNLIEEFMLLANKKVAEHIKSFKQTPTDKIKPFVYRVHDKPNESKLQQFSEFISKMGYKLNLKNKKTISNSLNNLFEEIEGKGEQNMIETIAVRTMSKAIYSTKNIGHYGLAFPDYTHFTSPIRRYPDLMVHRLLELYMENINARPDKELLEEKCVHCSEMERRATDAERDSIKLKQMEFMSDKIGKVFTGLISGVSKWGLFVELDICKAEGLIKIEDMKDDFYYLDEDNYQVVGHRNGKVYKLGDPISVIVKNIDLQKKQMDLKLVK
jgi:ribonuclease R